MSATMTAAAATVAAQTHLQDLQSREALQNES